MSNWVEILAFHSSLCSLFIYEQIVVQSGHFSFSMATKLESKYSIQTSFTPFKKNYFVLYHTHSGGKCKYTDIHLHLYTNLTPPYQSEFGTRSILKWIKVGLSFEFSFSLTSCHTKRKESSLYLPIAGEGNR